jgi:uncharacterized protein (TIGR03084 family)
MADLMADLRAEQQAVRDVLADVPPTAFDLPTRSAGWRIRDQIGHLAYYDEQAQLAASQPAEFTERTADLLRDPDAFAAAAEALGRSLTGTALLDRWTRAASASADAIAALPATARLPWYGPDMSVRSFVTARLMETWAHGTDVADALADAGMAVSRVPTDRLAHICHLGVITRGWSYTVRGLDAPTDPVSVVLELPSGESWSNHVEAESSIQGPAEDFCLVVTQRRNLADTRLRVQGEPAGEWLAIAQCFAGAATLPPPAR